MSKGYTEPIPIIVAIIVGTLIASTINLASQGTYLAIVPAITATIALGMYVYHLRRKLRD